MEVWFRELLTSLPGGATLALAVFIIAFLEALVGVGLIMPGSVLTVFSGWLAFQGKAPLFEIILAAAMGALCGDLLSFWGGARLGPTLRRHRPLRSRQELLRLAEIFFIEHGGKSVLIGRFIGPIRGLVPFIAGAGQMAVRPFFWYSALSGLLWGISYPGLGYLGGSSWQQAETLIGRIGWLTMLAFAAGVTVLSIRRYFLPKR
ncbi:MAG: hypothetical protein C0614_13045 [Desulfuromonas sp.]|nr:MAG: hypothetical protein C0614_13045 [Desulfuromonas sp.]